MTLPPSSAVAYAPKPEAWQRRHAKVCRYKADERTGLDLDGCCRCRYLAAVRGPRPGATMPESEHFENWYVTTDFFECKRCGVTVEREDECQVYNKATGLTERPYCRTCYDVRAATLMDRPSATLPNFRVPCPTCGAAPGAMCRDPEDGASCTRHPDRVASAAPLLADNAQAGER